MTVMTTELTGLRKAAVLLVQLGSEDSAHVLRSLRPSEVEALTAEIARLDGADLHTQDVVLGEFTSMVRAQEYYVQGGIELAEEMLVKTLGPERAKDVLSRLNTSLSQTPFAFLRRVDARLLLTYLQDEHPQTISLVLAHMATDQAAILLSGLPEEMQADVAHRLAVMDRTAPEIVRQVESHLEHRLANLVQSSDYTSVGGLGPLVGIINSSERSTERLILEGLEQRDPELAEEVRAQMFMFEDIVNLDDRAVQAVLRQVDTKQLALALKGVSTEVRDKITRNMSERAGAGLVEEIEVMGPVRLKQVEEAQAVIIRLIRSLEESGDIIVSRGGGGDDLVL
ncbi:flagellar motor switch protein FliG [Phycicoccus sp. Root101]|uniref:flagellar motor switch protein FliG n=1 Tax=Phycicoccus sp. Root101 TaxID=1736421 RepID=UPI000703731F|nr:flagellar motor switch protein FliG [Phycicoccus sp. Root101]KQU65270.1 flagellar motor switch protein FliG [Phycicoccus sp. Root101]